MEIFLIFATILFLVFGSILLLTPETFEKIARLANQLVFRMDEKVHSWRRPMGIMFLILAIFLWFVVMSK